MFITNHITASDIFTVIAVLLGTLFTSKATLPGWLWYVVLGDILFHAIMVIVLEIYSQIVDKKSNTLQPKGDDPAPSNSGLSHHRNHSLFKYTFHMLRT